MDTPASAHPGIFLESTTQAAAARLTELMEEGRGFAFLRLGDGELRFLLEVQGELATTERSDLRASCEIAHGSPALTRKDYERLLTSYERASVVDLHGELSYNAEKLSALRWQRAPQTIGTASSGRTALLFTWLHHELRGYLSRHRTVVCGAEATLLRELLTEPRFREIVESYWPAGANVSFVEPRNGGRTLSADLDSIKADLSAEIKRTHADTVLLSLGGGAKILCYELAAELGVCAIDFGSALRGLTYSGSDGQSLWRASHHPFLVRVPLELYMSALNRARPHLDPVSTLAKAHAQLCLDLQHKTPLHSHTSDVNDTSMFAPSVENLRNFNESMSYYQRHVLPLANGHPEAEALAAEFRRWRRKHGLGLDGKIFQFGVAAKAALRKTFAGR